MADQTVSLSYPDPPLTDGTVVLRHWAEGDIGCVEEASRDPHIPQGTTVPAIFTVAEGLAWIERQWGRPTTARDCRWQSLTQALARRSEWLP
jgi:hypothetical protein